MNVSLLEVLLITGAHLNVSREIYATVKKYIFKYKCKIVNTNVISKRNLVNLFEI